ncbi:MAG: sigma-E factor regulatory protein RseB domain-containing protein, partial [Gammaproteobacteria bacterium]
MIRTRGIQWLVLLCLAPLAAPAEEAVDWLRKMDQALNTLNYQGVFVRLRDGQVDPMKVIHRVHAGRHRPLQRGPPDAPPAQGGVPGEQVDVQGRRNPRRDAGDGEPHRGPASHPGRTGSAHLAARGENQTASRPDLLRPRSRRTPTMWLPTS